MVIRPKADTGRIGEAVALRRNGRCGIAKQLQLAPILGHLLIGRSEVAHQRVDVEPRHISAGREAQPVHARIDHDITGAPCRLPAGDLLRRVQYRPRAGGKRRLHVRGSHPVKDGEARVLWQKRLDLDRLCPSRDEKIAASRIEQTCRDINRAKAIAIGLHRSATGGRATSCLQPAPVVHKGIAIKAQSQGSRHHRRNSQPARLSPNLPCPTFPEARWPTR